MKNHLPYNNLWTLLTINQKSEITQMTAINSRLFFGRVIDSTANLKDSLPDTAPYSLQTKHILNGIERAFEQKRNVYLTYKSILSDSEEVNVSTHILYNDDNSITMCVMEINSDDIPHHSQRSDSDNPLLMCTDWSERLRNDSTQKAKILSISMENMRAYTWFYDYNNDTISYGDEVKKVNPMIERIDSLVEVRRRVHPADRNKLFRAINNSLKCEHGKFVVQYRIDKSDNGVYEWWESRGIAETVVYNNILYKYMIGMNINIDNHKITEHKLIQSNEIILNNINSGLAYISRDYMVQWENVSTSSAKLSHESYKKGELCYKSAHNRSTPCEGCILQRAVASKQIESIKFEFNNHNSIEVFATPIFNAKMDDIEGIVIRIDNVTEREQMIKELKVAKQQAEQSDKLKSAFLANMSHEIRTPLNAIVGFSALLTECNDNDEKEEFIRAISTNNDLLLKLVNDTLELSKIEAGVVKSNEQEFDLTEHLSDIFAVTSAKFRNHNVQLTHRFPYSHCTVVMDKHHIAQIVNNFLSNAIKYTSEGSIELGYECISEGIRIYVSDTGKGIPEDKVDTIFRRFEKLDEFSQGAGLGLAICEAIAKSMNGKIGLKSKLNQGSTFWVTLPCSPKISAITVEYPEE